MRQFASKGFRLWQLGVTAKLVYTAFCVFMLLGLLSSVLYGIDLMGPSAEGAVRYYKGQPASPHGAPAPAPAAGAAAKGPALELPDEAAAPATLHVGIPYRKLLEVSHFHLFTVPVVLLILAHLFMLTDLAELTKILWIALATAASFGHLAAPWILRYGSPRLGFLMPVTGVAMLGSMAVLTVYPVLAMWAGGSRRGRERAASSTADSRAAAGD